MALVSPGVEVTIIDESQYLPAPTNSVPFVLVATAQNKANATNTGVAAATTSANANKLFLVTSQRDLVNLYGTPFFYSTTNGTPIQGYELNEYGLLAAYSLLGVTNRCYVLRANVDLASLVGSTTRPVGTPAGGTYWLNTSTTTWGIYEFNSSTGKFTVQNPIVITDSSNLTGGLPNSGLGNPGDYAVNAIQITGNPSDDANKQFFYKAFNYITNTSEWVVLGSSEWKKSVPTIIATETNPTLTSGTFIISLSNQAAVTVNFTGTTVEELADDINNLGYDVLTAEVRSGKLCLFSNQTLSGTTPPFLQITGTLRSVVGIGTGSYYQVAMTWGTSAQMPLWTSSQTYPRPTGSVWMKVGSTGVGLNPVVSEFSTSTDTWLNKTVPSYTSDWAATAAKDSTGGQAIPAGTLYAQYSFDGSTSVPASAGISTSPVYIWERASTGVTQVVSSITAPTFTANAVLRMNVYVSDPGSATLSGPYNFELNTYTNTGNATNFVNAWNVPNTSAQVDGDGAIVLTHLDGGEIILDDHLSTANAGNFSTFAQSSGIISDAGFIIGTTDKVKYGPQLNPEFTGVTGATPAHTGNVAAFTVSIKDGNYAVDITSGGTGYSVDNPIVIDGTDLGGVTPDNDLTLKVTSVSTGVITGIAVESGSPANLFMTQLSNWVPITYASQDTAPVASPTNNQNWFYSVVDQVDIMIQKNGSWIGYRNTAYDSTGHPSASGSNTTDPNGPIISASAPTQQSDGTALTYGDLWIDTSDLENYPVIRRWQSLNGEDQWVLIDNADQVTSNGVVFADARWATSGSVDPVNDPIPTIKSLLTSDYLDLDAPDASLYPQGMLLFNTRRSGYNVKQFRVNYFNATSFPDQVLPAETSAWVSVSGNQSNGAPYMGRKAQRIMVVEAMRSAIDTNTDIRDEDNFFNLMATPNYPELQPNMIALNAARGETCYIIGDTPMGLSDSASDIQAWANNTANAASTGESGLVTRSEYMGLFYPSGLTTDLQGNDVVVPASHMMLRTFLRNDAIAFPWLAAAGTRRGTIDNALSIGYLNRNTGEYIPIKTRIGIRDTLYDNEINPLVFFTGVGLLNYGNKNSRDTSSALNRTNVARLVAYLRRQLTIAARPFVFEPNDAITRQEIAGVVQTLLVDLVAKRGIYDYLVVCDESNNTPQRIDRNELWVDVAIEPVKAAEFIYIPVRILNTGEIGNNAGQ